MMKEELFRIQRLCFKYGRINLADWAAQSLELYCLDQPNFYSRLDSLDWWRNLSILCDLRLDAPDGSISQAETIKDNEAFQRLLVVIYDEVVKAGYEHPAIKHATDTFRHWTEIDAYGKWKQK